MFDDTAPLHPRAFKVTVVWTLGLLFLGSVVHATESSLACPDWPTCYGTMVPEMTGGVFWEHLHRLVAGGLVLMFGLATWLARRETPERPWIFRACLAGLLLLVIQSVFGGLTVIYRLPDLVSTTHLALALTFLALASVLAAATSGPGDAPPGLRRETGRKLSLYSGTAALLVFVQSVVGGLVRHTDAGMSCPDVPLCLGQVVPPLVNVQITMHFLHRVLALVATAAVVALAVWAYRNDVPQRIRRWILASVALVLAQVGLGVASILTVLAVTPVSLHTLGAAALLSVLVAVATFGGRVDVTEERGAGRTATAGV
ncbi:MAG: COX15/CtaA family protein [Longimicrobiales bacterium]|nr:COX15/CtaA family protein [Longimicrobiales bacterium]